MTQALQRTNFHSSKLIRCLSDLAMIETVGSGDAFAEKLGLWVPFTDAIALSALHNESVVATQNSQLEIQPIDYIAASTEFERIKSILVHSIKESCSSNSNKTEIPLPVPKLELPVDFAAAYLPYRRFYEAHQSDMELRILPLKVKVREALRNTSPTLKKLAELDETLEGVLRSREMKLLARVPFLLKKRFEKLFKENQQADNPASWIQAGGWLARFCSDMQMLLLAELDFRLQTTLGLIEAFNQDSK